MSIRKIADGNFSLEGLDIREDTREALYKSQCTWQEVVIAARNQTLAITYSEIGRKREAEIVAAVGKAGFLLQEPVSSRGARKLLGEILRKADNSTEAYEAQAAFTDEQVGTLRNYLKAELTSKEATVLELRCGLDGKEPAKLVECARYIGKSREYARQIEAKAFRKMRVPARARRVHEILELPVPSYLQPARSSADQPGASVPLEKLLLSPRCYNCLTRNGINTAGDLTAYTESALRRMLGSASECIEEVTGEMSRLGLELKPGRLRSGKSGGWASSKSELM